MHWKWLHGNNLADSSELVYWPKYNELMIDGRGEDIDLKYEKTIMESWFAIAYTGKVIKSLSKEDFRCWRPFKVPRHFVQTNRRAKCQLLVLCVSFCAITKLKVLQYVQYNARIYMLCVLELFAILYLDIEW